MKLISLRISDGFYCGYYEFSDINVVYSEINGAGKTTLLRSILYALGYQVPSTKGVHFEDITFSLEVISNSGARMELKRRNSYLQLVDGDDVEDYSLPSDQYQLHKKIFGINNNLIANNLLGVFYFDQENGWTHVNRGRLIGGNNFIIEDFLCGLADKPCIEERNKLAIVEKEIGRCMQMIDVATYNESRRRKDDFIPVAKRTDEFRAEIELLRNQRLVLVKELSRVKRSRTSYNDFKNFIASIGLMVKSNNGEEIDVTPQNIVGLSAHGDFLKARYDEVRFNIAEIDNRIERLEKKFDDELTLIDVESALEKFDKQLAQIDIDKKLVLSRLNILKNEKRVLHEKIRMSLSASSSLVGRFHEMVNVYAEEMGLGKNFVRDIFMRSKSAYSGAVLHLIVFAFRISYVRLFYEKTHCRLPIIIDSPNGREIIKSHIDKTYEILFRDFSEHQIIIASIFNHNIPRQSMFNLTNGIMPELISKMQ